MCVNVLNMVYVKFKLLFHNIQEKNGCIKSFDMLTDLNWENSVQTQIIEVNGHFLLFNQQPFAIHHVSPSRPMVISQLRTYIENGDLGLVLGQFLPSASEVAER